ncbi:hypothetical protein [Aquimarina algicola]|uniref:Uncharacterized protein n=1 Tax=Aquimarina algicola TaxID=2589995 RepID=A0A504J0H1_9FLAO|nr:hypothetical protein [Aquimarina algicola]TPN83894.1 hypothetical protein FHK87_18180 [Aquimarina algicola]
MKRKKLNLKKIKITRLTHLHTIKGGTNMLSESECYPETRHPCIPDTKTDDDLLFTEDGRGG